MAPHDLRLLGPKLAVQPGEAATLTPEWSHGDGAGVAVPAADLARVEVKEGNDTAAPPAHKKPGDTGLRLTPKREGIVQAFVESQPKVVTKVVERDGRHGHRDAGRNEVKDLEIVSATRGRRFAKAIVVAGEPRGLAPPCGLAFEIVPLDPPSAWRPLAPLRFRVLLAGQPLAKAKLEAGAEGDSLGDGAEFPLAGAADADGVAALTFPEPGVWTLRAEQVQPAAAPDRARFDTERLVATLTMELRRPAR